MKFSNLLSRGFCAAFSLSVIGLISPLALAAEGPINVQNDIVYKTIGERDLLIDIYYPEKELKGEYPVIVYTHGGGWAAGSKNGAKAGSMKKVVAGVTKQGFCVVAVQYRLYKKGGNITIRDCVTDAKDAVRFLSKNREELHVNTDRVFTFGDSAGGQMAQMLLLSPPDLIPGDEELAKYSFKTVAGVSFYGPGDFQDIELYNHDDREKFINRFAQRLYKEGTSPEEKLALTREMSPVVYLKKESPPLLMIQGDGDTTIPVKHAYMMAEKAKEIGAPLETMIIKGAGHNWREAVKGTPIKPTRRELEKRAIDFFVEHKGEEKGEEKGE